MILNNCSEQQRAPQGCMADIDVGTLAELIRKQALKAAALAVRDLDKNMHSKLMGAAAHILGFSDRWGGKWELDHCNGRETLVSQYITREARELVEKYIKTIFTKKVIKSAIDRAKPSIINEFMRGFESTIKSLAQARGAKMAEDIFKDIFSGELKKISVDIDPSNPNLSGELEQAIMERIAKEWAEEMEGDQ